MISITAVKTPLQGSGTPARVVFSKSNVVLNRSFAIFDFDSCGERVSEAEVSACAAVDGGDATTDLGGSRPVGEATLAWSNVLVDEGRCKCVVGWPVRIDWPVGGVDDLDGKWATNFFTFPFAFSYIALSRMLNYEFRFEEEGGAER